MNKSTKKTNRELAMPFSSIALAERKIATEIIEKDSIRLIPTFPYQSACLQIVNTRFNQTFCFEKKERISTDLSELRDGLYFYELSLSVTENQGKSIQTSNKTHYQKGKFVMTAGFHVSTMSSGESLFNVLVFS